MNSLDAKVTFLQAQNVIWQMTSRCEIYYNFPMRNILQFPYAKYITTSLCEIYYNFPMRDILQLPYAKYITLNKIKYVFLQ